MTTGNKTISSATFGNTIFVVGATSSLAQAMCHALARQGHSLILAGRDEVELNMLACDLIVRHKISCLILAVDFLSPDFTAESFIRNAGTFDHMIIATGTMGNGEPLSLSDIAFTSHINYTLPAQIATLGAIKFASPPLTPPASGGGDRGGHSIVIISSVAGDRGRQSNYAYGSAKAALSSFASGLGNAKPPHRQPRLRRRKNHRGDEREKRRDLCAVFLAYHHAGHHAYPRRDF